MNQQSHNASAQAIASLQHDKINLQKQLMDFRVENQALRRQLYHMSTLLDVAVSKLSNFGVVLDAPIDIRALRTEAVKRANHCVLQSPLHFDDSTGRKLGAAPAPCSSKTHFQLKTEFREHSKCVQCSAFGGGGDPLLATGGLDCRLILYDFLGQEKRWDVVAHDQAVSDVAWFEGSGNLLSASHDASVRLWDPRGAESTPLHQHHANGFVLCIAALDRSFVFACSDAKRSISIVDVRSNKAFFWDQQHRANSLVYDASVGHLITGHSDGAIAIWDIRKVGVVLSAIKPLAPAKEHPGTTNSAPGSLFPTAAVPDAAAHQPQNIIAGNTPLSGSIQSGVSFYWSEREATSPLPHSIQPFDMWYNDNSRSAVSYLGYCSSTDGTKNLVSVSDDNMVRVYRGKLDTGSGNGPYQLRNVLPNVPSRGFAVRCGFWRGRQGKSLLPNFLDDGEKDTEMPVARHLTESDLVVTGGPDTKATVFDVTEEGSSEVLAYLEGHHDRVTGATICQSCNHLVIATTSADSAVRIWIPAKT